MAPHLPAFWIRKIDAQAIDEYGMLGLVLMENAGRGCADLLERLGIAGPVTICCGRGNNAGDGFVIARHLELRGYPVRVLIWSEPEKLRGDAGHNFRILERAGTPLTLCGGRCDPTWLQEQFAGSDWLVDALLGTGATGDPRPPFDAVIRAMNQSPARKLAVDLPSGLDCDSGKPSATTFRAQHTATFVAAKTGFQSPQAEPFVGQVHVLDVGAPKKLVEAILVHARQ